MHKFFLHLWKYCLWICLLGLVFVFFLGLFAWKFDLQGYVRYLNSSDVWNSLRQDGISGLWNTGSVVSSGTLFSGTVLTGEDYVQSGLDVYDPNFEAQLLQLGTGDVGSGEDFSGDFGFVVPESTGKLVVSTGKSLPLTGKIQDNRKALLQLIKEREH